MGDDAQNVEILLADEPGGSKVVLWHNGERWIVRYDERALGDHNNFECVDQWELRSETAARVRGWIGGQMSDRKVKRFADFLRGPLKDTRALHKVNDMLDGVMHVRKRHTSVSSGTLKTSIARLGRRKIR